MVILSTLRILSLKFKPIPTNIRHMSEQRILDIAPSRWTWTKMKDFLWLYFYVGVIPLGLLVLYANIYVGPATLSEIPEGYVPKYWEYYRNPVTRWIAQYCLKSPQQDYEKYLHYIFEEEEKRRIRILENQWHAALKERQDYKVYFYRPIMGKYHRAQKLEADEAAEMQGD